LPRLVVESLVLESLARSERDVVVHIAVATAAAGCDRAARSRDRRTAGAEIAA
jgi:hypothetical protein